MFSATWPMSVRQLAADFMTSPLRITVGSDSLQANSRVEQTAIVVSDGRQKEGLLLTHLRDNGFSQNKARSDAGGKDREKALIFALYKKEATRLFEMLQHKGFQVGCINGDMSQEKRTQSLADFKEGRVALLVATGESLSFEIIDPSESESADFPQLGLTDVAARGLDIPKVELVINVTFPLTIEDVRLPSSLFFFANSPLTPLPLSPRESVHSSYRTNRTSRSNRKVHHILHRS